MSPSVKSKPQKIALGKSPTFIVGQNPGHFRDGTHSGKTWHGNRSARLLWDIIENRQNLYLTNVCNYTIMTHERVIEGLLDLQKDIIKYKPIKIICLGQVAHFNVSKLDLKGAELFHFQHPSYVSRFNKDVESYKLVIREALNV